MAQRQLAPSVRGYWGLINQHMEGYEFHMYLDIKGLVTTGIGHLIPNVVEAKKIPWIKVVDGAEVRATPQEITAAYLKVKGATNLVGMRAQSFESLTDLRITQETADAITLDRLDLFFKQLMMESTRNPNLPKFDELHPICQFACMSIVWAVGVRGLLGFPKFLAALKAGRFETASRESHISEIDKNGLKNPGLRPRNDLNRYMLYRMMGDSTLLLQDGVVSGRFFNVMENARKRGCYKTAPTKWFPKDTNPED